MKMIDFGYKRVRIDTEMDWIGLDWLLERFWNLVLRHRSSVGSSSLPPFIFFALRSGARVPGGNTFFFASRSRATF
jgi:hypothetical protein